ncbi:ATP-binding cassette domain-containing protein [Leucobacter chromiireducens]|uniref:ATP-binding cassette domain-containing protein n=1 Tax=Leucobacter chromiireducens subsp. chromiireducens TaxID=660067 RepID=A0ABS1SSM9_9MICO|nr:ATP-binding cassette domain-containing protein [Leucobacter chromiireducens subsp. chromiireducens]
MTRVQLSGVGKRYPGRGKNDPEIVAVDDVSIEVASGEIHAIIGYSGAGKSTLLRLINGLERATSGTISVGANELTALSERQLRPVRSQIGMIFQQFNLFQSKTIAKNVEYPLVVAGVAPDERAARVAELLSFVGLQDRAGAYPDELSGGQKQRVGIARALATNPGVLLADEATSALDPETSREVLGLLKRVNDELGITIILITHEMDVVREIAHRVTVMDSGRAVEQGDVFEVFSAPTSETTRKFVATALPSEPGSEHLEQLRRRHRGRLVSLTFRDGDVDQPVVFRTLAERGVGVSIIHGGITDVGGRSFGKLTLELIGDELRVEHAVAALAQETELEVLA